MRGEAPIKNNVLLPCIFNAEIKNQCRMTALYHQVNRFKIYNKMTSILSFLTSRDAKRSGRERFFLVLKHS